MKPADDVSAPLASLLAVLDQRAGQYLDLAGAPDFGEYVESKPSREDEEILTEPILTRIVETVLGFPVDAYYPQYGRGGLKPDLTPMDLIAHRFVLDAKSSLQDLSRHESQIRAYVDQRQLEFGILFNLREVRTYRRGKKGHDPALSFALAPLWSFARGEGMEPPELAAFEAFVAQFRYRELSFEDRVASIASEESWDARDPGGRVEIDVDFLVERLRALSRLLAGDAEAQEGELLESLELNPGLEDGILSELEVLALDIAPGTSADALPAAVAEYAAATGDVAARTWKQYLLRVSQLALARILLYRSWEDAGFVGSKLYDGGFGQAFEQFGESVRDVLVDAFSQGSKAYRWLYGNDSNYDWYRPSDVPLVEVLYSLTPFPLGKLDADVLGGLYESYVDEIDRDRLGQFYTPRSVVRFMLGRAGLVGAEGVFHVEGDERNPLEILDFATGSGGFLVEAARRIIDEGGIAAGDEQGLKEALAAIVTGLHGSEISPFPYYLTEINLLLQVSRVLGALREIGHVSPPFTLSVVHADTLATRHDPATSMSGSGAAEGAGEGLAGDEGYRLVPLDARKLQAFERIRDGSFDLVVGNPPYVFEANNRILFERLRAINAWRHDYRGKSDLLYYFLALAAEKVADGGRLAVITPAGWMNAGNAGWLREKLASTLRLDELHLFGSFSLFAPEHEIRGRRFPAPTPTVESAILLATRAHVPSGHKLRIVALEGEAEAARTLGRTADARAPDRDRLLAEMAARFEGRQGRKRGIHVHDVRQHDLDHDVPWPIKHAPKDVASRVVKHLDGEIKHSRAELLSERWEIMQGVQTGADAYTARIRKRLAAEFPAALAELEARGAEPGAPIMELPAGAERAQPWASSPDLLARSIEPTAILYGALDEAQYTSLVWIGRDDEVGEPVRDALQPWRPVLANRAEIRRNASRRWFETAWPRSKTLLRRPKVIALYRTDRGRFALDEDGDWQPSIKTTLAVPKQGGLSVAYLCGLLNSELLDLWYGVRGKVPRDIWRNYEPKPMARIPYRHAAPASGPAAAIAALEAALEEPRPDAPLGLADELAPADLDAGLAARAVEALVRAIAANRRELLPLRPLAPELERTIKDPWRAEAVSIDEAALIASMPASELRSVRLDPGLSVTLETDDVLGRHRLEEEGIVFRRARRVTATVEGEPDRLALLSTLVGDDRRLPPDDLGSVLLPVDLDAFADRLAGRESEIAALLDRGRALVELVERIVCRLYRVPRELEDEIVASAVARAVDAG